MAFDTTTAPRNDYVGTNTVATYSYTFRIFEATDLRLTERDTAGVETALVYPTDYSVANVGNPNGGSITLLAGNLPTGYALTIRFDRAPKQSTDLRNQGGFFAEVHEDKFDELTRYAQAIRDVLDRSLHLPETEAGGLSALPTAALRANGTLGFDSAGALTILAGVLGTGAFSSFIATLLDDINQAAARTTLGVPAATGGALTNAVLTTSTVAADPTTALGIASKQYVDAGVSLFGVANLTLPATLATNVRLVLLSGASGTLTLPLAASLTNRIVTIKHNGTSLTQIYTIQTTAAEVTYAADGTSTTYGLFTHGEEITLFCDGVIFYVIQHQARTEWVDAGPMTIAGSGANPNKPTTPDLDHVYWRREGNQMFLRYILQISSAAGGTAGTGGYTFALPAGLAFDITVVSPVGSSMINSILSEAVRSALHGVATFAIDATSIDPCQLYAVSFNTFQAVRNTTFAVVGSGLYPLNTAEMAYYMEFQARCSVWRL